MDILTIVVVGLLAFLLAPFLLPFIAAMLVMVVLIVFFIGLAIVCVPLLILGCILAVITSIF
jgi:hypothetical protein